MQGMYSWFSKYTLLPLARVLVGIVVSGWRLDLVILEVSPNRNDSVIPAWDTGELSQRGCAENNVLLICVLLMSDINSSKS